MKIFYYFSYNQEFYSYFLNLKSIHHELGLLHLLNLYFPLMDLQQFSIYYNILIFVKHSQFCLVKALILL